MPEKVFYRSTDGVRICAILHEATFAPKGNVVLAHGITVDKDEEGAFVELATGLCAAHYNVLRFDFRGHGESGGLQEEMTIAGELHDLATSIDYARKRWSLPTRLVAASFGAVAAVIYAAERQDLPCMVLWNPGLDLRRTFFEPKTPWAQQWFNPEAFAFLEEHGYMLLEGFKIGRSLFEEMKQLEPLKNMSKITCPVLTLHGDKDTYASYEVSKAYAKCNKQSKFITVPGAEHGFGTPDERQFVISKTVEWFQRYLSSK